MIYEFDELSAATGAVHEFIRNANADCVVEVMMTNGGQCLQPPRTVGIDGLKQVLNSWLQAYPRSLVRYTIDDGQVVSASIWCHCTQSERRRCPIGKTCPGAPNSPKATIIVTAAAGKEVMLGGWKSTSAVK